MDDLIRTRLLKAGDVVTVHRCAGAYTELPVGLPEGTRVKVVSIGIGCAEVADDAGSQFNVYFPQIDMPKETLWRGQWVTRLTHPDGEQAFLDLIQERLTGKRVVKRPPGFTPEERARAIVAFFPGIPERIRPDVERAITSAIKKALNQQLAELEREADRAAVAAEGRGKQAKGRNPYAIEYNRMWEERFKTMRTRNV